jgi:hypothetical protein
VPSLDGARDKRAFECAGSPQNLNDRTTGIARMLS